MLRRQKYVLCRVRPKRRLATAHSDFCDGKTGLLERAYFEGKSAIYLSHLGKFCPCSRAALKGTNLRGQTPICGFLRVSAVFCGFLRKSAVFCENLRFPNASFSRKRRESAKISENLRKSAFGLGLSPLGSSP